MFGITIEFLSGGRAETVYRLMLIRLTDDSFVDDLCLHLDRSGFIAQRAGGSMVEVSGTDGLQEGRQDIELHLAVWMATNPGVGAELVG